MLDTPYIVLDTETTGLDPDKGARLIEVAAARWYKGACVGRFSCLVKQDEAAYVNSARALKKNGLSREFVEGAGVSRLPPPPRPRRFPPGAALGAAPTPPAPHA